MKNRNKLIMGSAIGLAMIATAIDHTKHRVPASEAVDEQVNIIIEDEESPCSMDSSEDSSPCGLGN
jgi:hypothetical protein